MEENLTTNLQKFLNEIWMRPRSKEKVEEMSTYDEILIYGSDRLRLFTLQMIAEKLDVNKDKVKNWAREFKLEKRICVANTNYYSNAEVTAFVIYLLAVQQFKKNKRKLKNGNSRTQ